MMMLMMGVMMISVIMLCFRTNVLFLFYGVSSGCSGRLRIYISNTLMKPLTRPTATPQPISAYVC